MNLKDKRILIFGGSGLLGSNLTIRLKELGCKNIHSLSSRDCDVRDMEQVKCVFGWQIEPVDIVINAFVSFGGILANEAHPGKIFYDNLQGNLNIIEACRKFEVEKLVQISSQCIYGNSQAIPFKESECWNFGLPTKNNAPYGISKRVLHIMVEAYKEEFGLNAVTLIPSNLYGPNDNFHVTATHVIPQLIRRFIEAKENNLESVEIWGTGISTRDFLYVKDAVDAIVLATENYDESNPVNIGSGKEVSIKELAELIAKLVGYTGNILYNNNGKDGQARRLSDISLAKEKFKFEPSTSLEQGLKETIKYFYENRHNLREVKIYD